MFEKAALLEILRNSLLPEVAGCKPTVCSATKNEMLTKLQPPALHVFKIQESSGNKVCCAVPFHRSKCYQVLQNCCSKQLFGKLQVMP